MFQASGTPFDSIESAHEFMTLLAQTVYEVKLDTEADVEKEQTSNVARRLDALRMAVYILEKLELQLNRVLSRDKRKIPPFQRKVAGHSLGISPIRAVSQVMPTILTVE